MQKDIKQLIEARETEEATYSRYEKTINRHRYSNIDNLRLSVFDMVLKYLDECDEEDKGIYRNHKFVLTDYQKQWKDRLMQKEYKYMITIKLPHREINGYKRTKNQEEAKKHYRDLIRQIERAYTGHSHWEYDGFDFNLAFEQGEAGYMHVHLAVVSNTMAHETYYNRLQCAINQVLEKTGLFNTCIKLTYVYDQEGLCTYLVKELESPDNNHLKKEYSDLASLRDWFHVEGKNTKPMKVSFRESGLFKMLSAAVKLKVGNLLSVPNPINKIQKNQIKLSKSSNKPARTKRKRKRL